MEFDEICRALGEWEGERCTFVARAGDEIRADHTGRLRRRREMEGSPTLAMFCLQDGVNDDLDGAALTLIDFTVSAEARGDLTVSGLVIYQGDVAMDVRRA